MDSTMRLILLAIAAVSWSAPSLALDAEQQHGQALLQKMCAQCHAVGTTGESPNKSSPRFRDLGEDKLYDPAFLQRLQDGYSSIHRFMPTFRFTREDAEAVSNYLKAIQLPRRPN